MTRTRRLGRRAAFVLATLALSACGDRHATPGTDAAPWRAKLLGAPAVRDPALVELRRQGPAGVPLVLALLGDGELVTAPAADTIREELAYMLGEHGSGDGQAQSLLERFVTDTATPVPVALAAARGLVVSWRAYRDPEVFRRVVAVFERATTPEDARKAVEVQTLFLTDFRLPWDPAYLATLRKASRSLRTCGFALRCLRRYEGRQPALLGDYRGLKAWLDTDPGAGDASLESEKLAVREALGEILAELEPR